MQSVKELVPALLLYEKFNRRLEVLEAIEGDRLYESLINARHLDVLNVYNNRLRMSLQVGGIQYTVACWEDPKLHPSSEETWRWKVGNDNPWHDEHLPGVVEGKASSKGQSLYRGIEAVARVTNSKYVSLAKWVEDIMIINAISSI